MLKKFLAIAAALGLAATAVPAAEATTVKILVMQSDKDTESLRRNSRIQNAVLTAFNQGLSAPTASDIFERYGIEGLDVYDEVRLTLPFDTQNRIRRSDQELLTVLDGIRSPRLDIVVLYTIYAKAVKANHAEYTLLQMSLNYRALDVRSGQFLGGDNLDVDTRGIPMTGCAAGSNADSHCVKEFVAEHGQRLVQDASVTLATQVAAMIGPHAGQRKSADSRIDDTRGSSKDDYASGEREEDLDTRTNRVCRDFPRQFRVTFQGLTKRDVRYVTERMDEWPCRIDIGLEERSASRASYTYKVRADEAKLARNLEMTLEFIGIDGDVTTSGRNELIVKAKPLRHN